MATAFTQNKYSVFIEENGEMREYTEHVPFPIKVSELLDEQLDEANLSLVRVERENIPPLTKVEIETWNSALSELTLEEKDVYIGEEIKGEFLNRYKVFTVGARLSYLAENGIEVNSLQGIKVKGRLESDDSLIGKPITVISKEKGVYEVTFQAEADERFVVESVTLTVEGVSVKEKKTFYVSSDSAEELPVGSGKYTHALYLIEETKWLERFIIPATGFVNALGRTYV